MTRALSFATAILALAVPISLWVLVPDAEPPDVPLLIAVFLGLVAAESFNVHIDHRCLAATGVA